MGTYLSAQSDFAEQAVRLATAGPLWREVLLLAVGRLIHLGGDTAKPLALVAELCPVKALDTDIAWQQAWLAGDPGHLGPAIGKEEPRGDPEPDPAYLKGHRISFRPAEFGEQST